MHDIVRSARSKVRRLPKRAHYDRETAHAILDAGLVCHVGYVIDGQPYVTPTNYWREGERVYWHGSSASRMLRFQAGKPQVCFTVTHLDGLVLARSGFHHSVNYRSVMLFGEAQEVTDPAEKRAALDRFIDRIAPGRNAELRPINDQELKATRLFWLPIEEGSAKVRTGAPVDDEEDYALPVWAGVLPVRTVLGAPEPDPRLAPGTPAPAHLGELAAGVRLDEALQRSAKRY